MVKKEKQMKIILSIITILLFWFVLIFTIKAFDKDYVYSCWNGSKHDLIVLDCYHGESFEYGAYTFTYLFKD